MELSLPLSLVFFLFYVSLSQHIRMNIFISVFFSPAEVGDGALAYIRERVA